MVLSVIQYMKNYVHTGSKDADLDIIMRPTYCRDTRKEGGNNPTLPHKGGGERDRKFYVVVKLSICTIFS